MLAGRAALSRCPEPGIRTSPPTTMLGCPWMRKLNRRQYVEIRRMASERYLQIRLGRGWRIYVRGGRAIVEAYEGSLQVILPLKAILESDGLRRRGF